MPPHPAGFAPFGAPVSDVPVARSAFCPVYAPCVLRPGRGRVAILSVSPEIADLSAAAVKRLGHDPVAAVAPRRRVAVLRTALSQPSGESIRIDCGDGPWVLQSVPAD
jgi:hypothetical protein